MKEIVVDMSLCNGCHNCQIACKDEHCGNDWSPIALPQPMTGQFWCRVDETELGRVPWTRVRYTPLFCGHCDEAPCLAVGGDAVYRRDDGLVIIDPEKARDMRHLVDACPAGAIFWNEELRVPQKCTGCAHLLDDGWSEPRCVDACATGALRYVDAQEVCDLGDGAVCLQALEPFGPHVRYVHYPKNRIVGTVADRVANEVVIGAQVTVTDECGAIICSQETDEFGDFKFEGCDEGVYRVGIAATGYERVVLEADTRVDDAVLGDVIVVRAEGS